MSNDFDYPIWQGTDQDEALAAIRRLSELGGGDKPGFDRFLYIYTATAADLASYAGLNGWCHLDFDPPGADAAAALLSSSGLNFNRYGQSGISLELDAQAGPVVARLADGTGAVSWDPDAGTWDFDHALSLIATEVGKATWIFRVWPPVPSLDLLRQPKHVGAELVINGDSINSVSPVPISTLYVTVGPWPGEEQRAEWLAAQVGLTVIGPGESA